MELRVDSQRLQRLVHLLTALNRHVEVAFAAEKQRRRLNAVRMQERIEIFTYVSMPSGSTVVQSRDRIE